MALNMNINTHINMDQYIEGSIWHQSVLSDINLPIQPQFILMHIDAGTSDQYTLMHIDTMNTYWLCIDATNILMHQYTLMCGSIPSVSYRYVSVRISNLAHARSVVCAWRWSVRKVSSSRCKSGVEKQD